MQNDLPTNKPGSKGFYETMAQFEKDILGFKGDSKSIREDRSQVPAGVFYKNGNWDMQFKCYLAGAAYMRALAI